MSSPEPVRVRFAPSPTGRFHIGGARTALYNYLIARQTGGQFILRIEDTDRKRYVPTAEQEIIDSLHWLGIDWDEGPDRGGPAGPYRQSERISLHQQHAQLLVDRGQAFVCFCSPERLSAVRQAQQQAKQPPRYDGLCRQLSSAEVRQRLDRGEASVVRFKTPQAGTTEGHDLLRGLISVENANLDDYILLKSDGLPVYHLAAMVDDHEMGISHVLRGSEWLPTFPLHVLIYQAFGWTQPTWVHLSIFLNPSGKGKLSKRHAADPSSGIKAVFTADLEGLGYLPEAVNNWIALMGWAYDDKTELFPMPTLIESFSLEKLNPSPAAVDFSKLDHFNGLYIRGLELDDLAQRMRPFFESQDIQPADDMLLRIAPLIRERMRTLDEAPLLAGFFFKPQVALEPAALVGKNLTAQESAAAARRASEVIRAQPTMEVAPLEAALRALAEELGLKAGQLFGILRTAVTGQEVSPPLIESMEIIGKQAVLQRLEHAADLLEGSNY